MSKKGDEYEKLVQETLSIFDPSCIVERGNWINGPDGRRDRDVLIQGTVNGSSFSILIECKDFSKNTRVGIQHVDALDSKRHDVGVDKAIICSNSGFTRLAISKAKRKGVGLISILKSRDSRAKAEIIEEIYTRRVKVSPTINVKFHSKKTLPLQPLNRITYKNVPLLKWIYKRIVQIVMSNPTGNTKLIDTLSFKMPIKLAFGSECYEIISMDIKFEIETQWFSQIVIIDALAGIYDYLIKKTILASGENQYIIKGVDVYGGKPINFIPEYELYNGQLQKGEMRVNICLIENIEMGDNDFPLEFGDLINPKDLNLTIL